jgi:hypothetical protein
MAAAIAARKAALREILSRLERADAGSYRITTGVGLSPTVIKGPFETFEETVKAISSVFLTKRQTGALTYTENGDKCSVNLRDAFQAVALQEMGELGWQRGRADTELE